MIDKKSYSIYENDEHIGTFFVEYKAECGYELSAKLDKFSISFWGLVEKDGTVTPDSMDLWLAERIIPKTRIGIETNLKAMGLDEYDELDILKYTKGCHPSDSCYIDFTA